jgi:putative protease
MIKPELILPAGSFDKVRYALAYGADAVYAGLPQYSLRNRYIDFDEDDLLAAIAYTRRRNRRFYAAVNLFAHEEDLLPVQRLLEVLSGMQPDGIIVSDPGIFRLIRNRGIDAPIHLSTQANTTNSESIGFWHDQGVSRVILARELSCAEVERICCKSADTGMELEIFIHGAMCISYSGRCLLSSYLTGRDANRGECAGTCRWRYELIEESREDQRFEVEEDSRGSYILNSKDLCLLPKIALLRDLPLHGYKIEGRTKNLFYVSLVARAYRSAIDAVFDDHRAQIDRDSQWLIDLTDSHGFTTGFMFPENEAMQSYGEGAVRKQRLIGLVRKCEGTSLEVAVKNPLSIDDELIGITPSRIQPLRILHMYEEGKPIHTAYGARKQQVTLEVDSELNGPDWTYGLLVKK